MANEEQNDFLRQIRESLERAYAEESPAKKRIRQMNRNQIEIAGSGEWDDPFGRPANPGCRKRPDRHRLTPSASRSDTG